MNPFNDLKLGPDRTRDIESQIETLEDEVDELRDELSDLEGQIENLTSELNSALSPILDEIPKSVRQNFIQWIHSRCSWAVRETIELLFDGIEEDFSKETLATIEHEWNAFSLTSPTF